MHTHVQFHVGIISSQILGLIEEQEEIHRVCDHRCRRYFTWSTQEKLYVIYEGDILRHWCRRYFSHRWSRYFTSSMQETLYIINAGETVHHRCRRNCTSSMQDILYELSVKMRTSISQSFKYLYFVILLQTYRRKDSRFNFSRLSVANSFWQTSYNTSSTVHVGLWQTAYNTPSTVHVGLWCTVDASQHIINPSSRFSRINDAIFLVGI